MEVCPRKEYLHGRQRAARLWRPGWIITSAGGASLRPGWHQWGIPAQRTGTVTPQRRGVTRNSGYHGWTASLLTAVCRPTWWLETTPTTPCQDHRGVGLSREPPPLTKAVKRIWGWPWQSEVRRPLDGGFTSSHKACAWVIHQFHDPDPRHKDESGSLEKRLKALFPCFLLYPYFGVPGSTPIPVVDGMTVIRPRRPNIQAMPRIIPHKA